MVTHFCALMFSIDPFHGTILCDVDPLHCAYLLLEISYQEKIHAIYHAHQQQYHIYEDGHTYVPISSSLKYPALFMGNTVVLQVSMHQHLSLCIV